MNGWPQWKGAKKSLACDEAVCRQYQSAITLLGDLTGRYDIPFYNEKWNRLSCLYKRWFESYPRRNELTLQAETLNFEGYVVYTGMILRKDNPDYESLLNSYEEFVKRANSIYHIQPK